MKVFTQRSVNARNFCQAEDYNNESSEIVGEFNGLLAGQQVPYASVTADKFTLGTNLDGSVKTTPAGASNGVAQQKPTQLFAITQTSISDFAGFDFPEFSPLTNILGPPSKTYATNSTEWGPGWNRYSAFIADGVYLSVPVRTGILKGCALVDFEFYEGEQGHYGAGSGLVGKSWTWEIGVFVDGVLTAKTGPMSPRRHTVCLPFARPVPHRRIEIDVRWRANYDGIGVTGDYSFVSDTALRSYNHTLWIRNQYR